jgi:hypothetical protein
MDAAGIVRLTASLLPRVVLVAGPIAWLLSAGADFMISSGDPGLLLSPFVLVFGVILVDGFATTLAVEMSAEGGLPVRRAAELVSARIGALIGVSLLLLMVVIAVALPVQALYVAQAPLPEGVAPPRATAPTFPDFAGRLGISLLITMVTIRWALATPIAIYGSQGVLDTLRASWRASGAVFMPLLLLFVALAVVSAILTTASEFLAPPLNRIGDLIVSPLGSSLTAAIWIALGRPVAVTSEIEEAR